MNTNGHAVPLVSPFGEAVGPALVVGQMGETRMDCVAPVEATTAQVLGGDGARGATRLDQPLAHTVLFVKP